jgi:uncharacterized protein
MLNPHNQPLDFGDLLVNLHISSKPSGIHGIVCGLVCAGADLDGKVWIDRIVGQMSADTWAEAPSLLLRLYDQVSRQMSGVEFKFEMLLPDNSQSLAVRTLALTQWCQGFLSGLQMAGVDFSEVLTEDLVEILYRFSELAQLDRAQIETTDEDILTFADLREFIRKSVWALYTARTYSHALRILPSIKKALH